MTKIVFAVCVGLVACALPAFALVITPSVSEISLEPGDTYNGSYDVLNDTDVAVQVTVVAENWLTRLFNIEDSMQVTDWLKLDGETLTIQPGETQKVFYVLQAPFRFADEKVAQVFFEFSAPAHLEQVLKTRVGVILYMTPRGAEKVLGTMTDCTVQYGELFKGDNAGKQGYRVLFTVMNEGNVHVRPKGLIELRSTKSNTVIETAVIEPSKGVYPEKTESFEVEVPAKEALSAGEYEATVLIDIGSLHKKEVVLTEKTLITVEVGQ